MLLSGWAPSLHEAHNSLCSAELLSASLILASFCPFVRLLKVPLIQCQTLGNAANICSTHIHTQFDYLSICRSPPCTYVLHVRMLLSKATFQILHTVVHLAFLVLDLHTNNNNSILMFTYIYIFFSFVYFIYLCFWSGRRWKGGVIDPRITSSCCPWVECRHGAEEWRTLEHILNFISKKW